MWGFSQGFSQRHKTTSGPKRPQRLLPSEFRKDVYYRYKGKTNMIGLHAYAEESMMLCRFDTIPECNGQQTDGQNCYINIARQQCCADER